MSTRFPLHSGVFSQGIFHHNYFMGEGDESPTGLKIKVNVDLCGLQALCVLFPFEPLSP